MLCKNPENPGESPDFVKQGGGESNACFNPRAQDEDDSPPLHHAPSNIGSIRINLDLGLDCRTSISLASCVWKYDFYRRLRSSGSVGHVNDTVGGRQGLLASEVESQV